jgi:Legionella pneumophila major outer membrane protein precursor
MSHRNVTRVLGLIAAGLLGSVAYGQDIPHVISPLPDSSTRSVTANESTTKAQQKGIAEQSPETPEAKSTLLSPATPPGSPSAIRIIELPPRKMSRDNCWSGLYGGASILFLTPSLSNNVAYNVTRPPVPPAPGAFPAAVGSSANVPFEWDYETAWRYWAGWSSVSGIGVRVGGFMFDRPSDTAFRLSQPNPSIPEFITIPEIIPFIPGTAEFASPSSVLDVAGIGVDQLTFKSSLNIETLTVEGTYTFDRYSCLIQFMGGVQFTSVKQQYHAQLLNPGDGVTTEFQQLDSLQEFRGSGPSIGVFLRHGLWGGGLAAYANLHGAVLFGKLEQQATFVQAIQDPNFMALAGSQTTHTRFDNRADHTLTTAEIELGLEYGFCMGHSRVFVRCGIVGQSYGNVGNASSSLGTLSLVGSTISVGLNY